MTRRAPTSRKLQERRIRSSHGVSKSRARLIASLFYGEDVRLAKTAQTLRRLLWRWAATGIKPTGLRLVRYANRRHAQIKPRLPSQPPLTLC